MDFVRWLQYELDRRSWSQSELVRRSEAAGYKISQSQLSNVMSRNRQAGPDTCIALAHALGVKREEVFQARGWLSESSEELSTPLDPRATRLARELSELTPSNRDVALNAIEPVLDAVRQLSQEIERLSSDGQSS